MATTVDSVIVGQGLAGTTLAWRLLDMGQRVAIIDQPLAGAASHVAAGLITPLTGKKLKPEVDFRQLKDIATTHYTKVGQQLGVPLIEARPAIRCLDSAALLDAWQRNDNQCKKFAREVAAPSSVIHRDRPYIEMMDAARLATQTYLSASRREFEKRDMLINAVLEDTDVTADTHSVSIDILDIRSKKLIFCRGFRDMGNRWFPELEWRPAKGQVIELQGTRSPPQATLHANGVWLTQRRDGRMQCGATYAWSGLTAGPDQPTSDLLFAKLASAVRFTGEQTGAATGVRPIVSGRKPVIGFSQQSARVALFGGLGSKGSLYAPAVGQALAEAMLENAPIPAVFDLDRRIQRI